MDPSQVEPSCATAGGVAGLRPLGASSIMPPSAGTAPNAYPWPSAPEGSGGTHCSGASVDNHSLCIYYQDFASSLSLCGEGNGNPLQYSCLENPMDRGAWWAAVYGVTQSQTRLKRLSSSSSSSPFGLKSHSAWLPKCLGSGSFS